MLLYPLVHYLSQVGFFALSTDMPGKQLVTNPNIIYDFMVDFDIDLACYLLGCSLR